MGEVPESLDKTHQGLPAWHVPTKTGLANLMVVAVPIDRGLWACIAPPSAYCIPQELCVLLQQPEK